MTALNALLSPPPFSLPQREKERRLAARLAELTAHHYRHCRDYRRILDAQSGLTPPECDITRIPFIPVSLFKMRDLVSVSPDAILKTVTSSGTSGQARSRVFLDRQTASYQQKALVNIVSDFIGPARRPLLIIDSPTVMTSRHLFSARGAGILGFSLFGSEKAFALTPDMALDFTAMRAFLQKHRGREILLFGFTFMVWQHFYQQLLASSEKIDLSLGTLIHGGGWKKLGQQAVTPDAFAQALRQVCHIRHIHDYYGMAEQTGSIAMQCQYGHLHASLCSDVIMRRHHDFSLCRIGEPGLIQVVSALPHSYPGHSLLTEDLGVILGVDDCPCGRYGKYFHVSGRVKNADIRGCSDTYAESF